MGYWGIPIRIESVATDPVDTDRSTSETICKMIDLAKASSHSPAVSAIVDSCLRSIRIHPAKRDLARAIYLWVKNHITFTEDEQVLGSQFGYQDTNQELLIAPEVLLSMPTPQGDCDDFSTLIASLLLCAGLPCWFVTIAADGAMPWKFSHVYVMTYLDDERRTVTLDASHGNVLGWEYEKQFRRMEWFIG